jgi:outer membrane protein assembly factor BamB
MKSLNGRVRGLFLVWMAGAGLAEAGGEWNQFRGPNGSGVAEAAVSIREFGPERGVLWKARLPMGKSSPVFAGGRIFLTGHEGERLLTLALDAKSGRELWRREAPGGKSAWRHPLNDRAAPTPVTDGRSVYSFFAAYGVVSYSREGRERWRYAMPGLSSLHGVSASPVLHEKTLVLVCDQTAGSFIVALDTATGKERWKKVRTDSAVGVYASPVVFTPPGEEAQVVVIGNFEMASYSAATGERLWWVTGLPMQAKASPVANGNTVYLAYRAFGEGITLPGYAELVKGDRNGNGAMEQPETAGPIQANFKYIDTSGDGSIDEEEWNSLKRSFDLKGAALAIRPAGRGDLTETAVLWRMDRGLPEVPTPLYYRGVVYLMRTGGILTSVDGASGVVLKSGRVTQGGGAYYASPVAAGNDLYVTSESGRVTVLKAGGEWEVVREVEMGEEVYATPAIVDGRLFVRTGTALYAFGGG